MSVFNEQIMTIISRKVPVKKVSYRFDDKAWFSAECRAARDAKQAAYHRWSRQRSRESWDEYVHARSFAVKTYRDAEKEYVRSVRKKLSNSSDPHKWWSTLKSAVFGSCSSLPPLLSDGGELVTNPKGKDDLLMTHFDSKLSRKQLYSLMRMFMWSQR